MHRIPQVIQVTANNSFQCGYMMTVIWDDSSLLGFYFPQVFQFFNPIMEKIIVPKLI